MLHLGAGTWLIHVIKKAYILAWVYSDLFFKKKEEMNGGKERNRSSFQSRISRYCKP